MFKNLNSDGNFLGGQSSSSLAGHGAPPPGLVAQESPWIGLLSRPAAALLQRLLPTRTPPSPAMTTSGWLGGELGTSLVQEESEFLRQWDDILPGPPLSFLRCDEEREAGVLQPGARRDLPWLTAGSLQEIGIQEEEMHPQFGYLSPLRTAVNQLFSLQEHRTGKDWVPHVSSSPSTTSTRSNGVKTWWGNFWSSEKSSEGALQTWNGSICPEQQPAGETIAAETDPKVPEKPGVPQHKEEEGNVNTATITDTTDKITHQTTKNPTDITIHNTNTHTVGPSAEDQEPQSLSSPDQDYGYSSLEEEQVQRRRVSMEKIQREEEEQQVQTSEEESSSPQEVGRVEALTAPQCDNKTIAFIMGCPCSDDSQSEEEEDDDDDDDDDDGFDSEGSSDLSDSSDEEEEDSDLDSEADRLWTSLSRSVDPYNPRNFTASLHTSSSITSSSINSTCITSSSSSITTSSFSSSSVTQPRNIPGSSPPSSAQSTPASSPPGRPLAASPLVSSSCSPPSAQDSWDDSASASEVDEAESLRLLSSFSCSSDPYSPFNFQAPLRTRAPPPRAKARKASQSLFPSPSLRPASPPEYRKEEAEERLDSGFSEIQTSSSSCTKRDSIVKKVRFSEVVEEFFACCGEEEEEEDRRGPWEELARDRCRFVRRCLEVEERISFCLQPEHRRKVYLCLTTTSSIQQDL